MRLEYPQKTFLTVWREVMTPSRTSAVPHSRTFFYSNFSSIFWMDEKTDCLLTFHNFLTPWSDVHLHTVVWYDYPRKVWPSWVGCSHLVWDFTYTSSYFTLGLYEGLSPESEKYLKLPPAGFILITFHAKNPSSQFAHITKIHYIEW